MQGYYVDTVGKNSTKIKEYIQNQLKDDELGDRLPFDKDPFKESTVSRVWQVVKKGF